MSLAALGSHAFSIFIGIAAAILGIFLHECGHLVAGMAAGFRFHLLVLGPVQLHRDHRDRVRPGWNREPALWGGGQATIPVRTEGLRAASALAAAGGPLANLLVMLLALLALPLVGPHHHVLVVGLKFLALVSACLAAVNLVPMANGPFVTDGLRLLRILDRGPLGDREAAIWALAALEAGGVRARDWDEALLRRGLAVRDGTMYECQCHLWAYLHALDADRVAEAGEALDRAIALAARAPDSLRQPCVVESAYFDAAHRGRARIAAATLAAVPRKAPGVTAADRLRAEAAIALAECRRDEAARLVERALECVPPHAATERAWLEALRERAAG